MCLRILHVVGIMGRGGTETLIMNLYRKMDRDKVQFDFMVHSKEKGSYDDEIRSLGGKIYYISHYNGINHFTYVKEWNTFFRDHSEYSIIHGHMRSTAAIYLKIAKKNNIIAIAHSHNTGSRGSLLEKFVKKFMQYPIRYLADYFFACSLQAGIWLFGKKICRSNSFRILNNAIDSSAFVFCENIRKQKRKELNIENRFAIGHVGNFDPQKNHSFLIDIFDNICKKNEECLLFLVGGGDLALKKDIKKKVMQKGLTQKVQFLGSRSDVNELLNAFDVFLFPSHHEGLGIVAVEAQANGLQCVLSDAIPQEVEVSDHVEFISLKKSADFWSDRVLAYKTNYERVDMQENIIEAGYDINDIAQWLAGFYLNLKD